MADWASYTLSDFLAFAPETYWRLFERMNAALWPAHVPLLLALVALTASALKGWRHASAVVAVGLAAAWAVVAQLFLATHYLPINWAIGWIVPFAWAQVALLLVLAPGLSFARRGHTWPAIALIALALAYPMVGIAFGRTVTQAEIAGLAPDPTALLTLGLMILARPGWRGLVLSMLPVGWCAVSAATLLTMQERSGWVLVAALSVATIGLVRRARKSQTPN